MFGYAPLVEKKQEEEELLQQPFVARRLWCRKGNVGVVLLLLSVGCFCLAIDYLEAMTLGVRAAATRSLHNKIAAKPNPATTTKTATRNSMLTPLPSSTTTTTTEPSSLSIGDTSQVTNATADGAAGSSSESLRRAASTDAKTNSEIVSTAFPSSSTNTESSPLSIDTTTIRDGVGVSSSVGSSLLSTTRETSSLSLQPASSISSYTEPEPLMADTNPKTVLLTGGAGFIGSHVGEALLERGDSVVVVDEMNDYYSLKVKRGNLKILRNHPNTRIGDNLKIYKGDICNETLLERIFQETQPTHICHLAARAGVRPSVEDPFVYIHSNVEGTTRLLEMARQNNVTNFVYASSSSVYGGLQQTVFTETQQLDHPWSQYAATKKSTELMASTYSHLYDLKTTGLRFFTVYGPRGRPDMAPYKFVKRVSQCLPIQQYGDGSAVRDFTYIDDIVDGIIRSIDRPYPCEVFNLGRGNGIQLNQFIGLVEKHTGRKANIEVLPNQIGDVPYTMADLTKAQRLLGYNPSITFEEGIRRTVEWYNTTQLSHSGSQNCKEPQQKESSLTLATPQPKSESDSEAATKSVDHLDTDGAAILTADSAATSTTETEAASPSTDLVDRYGAAVLSGDSGLSSRKSAATPTPSTDSEDAYSGWQLSGDEAPPG